MPLDMLVTGRIATFAGPSGFGWVEAVGIRGGRVAFAGSAVDLETRVTPHTVRVDLEPGEIAIPGLTDAHIHYLDAALATEHVDLTSAMTLDEGLERLVAADRVLPAGAWLQGGGWDQRRWGGWLKLFADGTLGSQTAALLEPREGSTDLGVFRQGPEELADLARRAAEAGIATQIHAIGDGAVRAALDALAPTSPMVPLMPRLEHVQLVHPSDRRRFATHGIAASVQPVHLREDADSARRDWGQRAESCGYTWNTLVASGAVLAFGTDAPVEPIDPWPGIALSVLRRDPSWGPDAVAFGPQEALDLEQALRAATLGPAQAARETDRGHLMPGARADLATLALPAGGAQSDSRA